MNEETMTPQKKTLSLPLLITRGLIVFPNMGETIEVGRAFSMAAVDEAKANTNSLIFVVAQRDAQKEDPAEEDLPGLRQLSHPRRRQQESPFLIL